LKHLDGDGEEIKLGDSVGFKSDTEQVGEVISLLAYGKVELYDPNGFSGSYLRYAKTTIEEAKRCWLI
jgi:hypothetical protein